MLLQVARRRQSLGTLPAVADAPIPYQWPTAVPWNAPQPALVPTYDGSDQPTHPSVVDMVAETGRRWHGYRYWMAHTPYPNGNALLENPSIVVSNNGYDWHDTEVGITNPIVPHPGGPGGQYNSDSDIAWDPERRRMWMIHRTTYPASTCNVLHTTDGLTWTTTEPLFALGSTMFVSPCLVRIGPALWRMFAIGEDTNGRQILYKDAASPAGPWGATMTATVTYGAIGATDTRTIGADGKTIWHMDINAPTAAGIMRGAVVTYPVGRIHPMTSNDGGVTWVVGPAILANAPSGWDYSAWLYRPTIVADGGHYLLWYPAHGQSGAPTYIGVARIPASLWPS